jgi:hypothetical protein
LVMFGGSRWIWGVQLVCRYRCFECKLAKSKLCLWTWSAIFF